MVDLMICCRYPYSSATMAAPFPNALTMISTQVTNQDWSVAYFLWIPTVEKLDLPK